MLNWIKCSIVESRSSFTAKYSPCTNSASAESVKGRKEIRISIKLKNFFFNCWQNAEDFRFNFFLIIPLLKTFNEIIPLSSSRRRWFSSLLEVCSTSSHADGHAATHNSHFPHRQSQLRDTLSCSKNCTSNTVCCRACGSGNIWSRWRWAGVVHFVLMVHSKRRW